MAELRAPRPTETGFYSDVMTCPACDGTIKAKVTARVEFGQPALKSGAVELPARTSLRHFNIQHSCPGPIEAEDDAPTSPEDPA